MNKKLGFIFLGLINLVFILFLYSMEIFPFSSVTLFISSFLILEHLVYTYFSDPESLTFNVVFIIVILAGLYETFIIEQGVLFNNLIVAIFAIVIFFIVKWSLYGKRYSLNPVFTIIASIIFCFVLYSKVYIITSFVLIIPWQINAYYQKNNLLKNILPYIEKKSKVLDLDGDKGLLLFHLKELTGCSVIGVDDNPNSKKLSDAINLGSIYNSINEVEFMDNFDLVIALKFGDRKFDTSNFISECRDLISKDGFLVLSVNKDHDTYILVESLKNNGFEITKNFVTNILDDDNINSLYLNNINQIFSGFKTSALKNSDVKRRVIIAKLLHDKGGVKE